MNKKTKIITSWLVGIAAFLAGFVVVYGEANFGNVFPVVEKFNDFNYQDKITEDIGYNLGLNLPKRDFPYRVTLTISELDPADPKQPVIRRRTLQWLLQPKLTVGGGLNPLSGRVVRWTVNSSGQVENYREELTNPVK